MLGRELEIRVGKDDGGILAAELELHLLARLRRLQLERAADRVRAGEGDRVDAVVCDEGVADDGAAAEHEVEYAVRQPRVG